MMNSGYCGSDCISCSQVCDCIKLSSPEGSILITKDGCKWGLEWNPDSFTINSGLLFNNDTRELCMEVNGEVTCVTIPDSDDQYLTLVGSNLNIVRPDGTIVNTINLNALQITFAATSASLTITPGGSFGHTPNIEIEPSSDLGNIFVLGLDGKPYVPETLTPPTPTQTPITGVDTNTVDLITSGTNQHTITADVKYQNSDSIEITDDNNGLEANLRIDSTSTADVSITLDGLKVNAGAQIDVNIVPIQGISFTKSVIGNIITFTPQLDFIYIASQICPLCPPPEFPCNAPTVTITNITDGTIAINVTPLASGDTYDISLDGGISWLILDVATTTYIIGSLPENTNYELVIRLHCIAGGTVNTIEQDVVTLDCADISNLSVSVTGTTANMTWTAALFMIAQQPQYKLTTTGIWTNTAITTSNTMTVNGLLPNRLYDFRVNTNCHNPNTSVSNSPQAISFSCPTVTATGASQTTINYNFPPLNGTSITLVKVDLLNNAGTTVLQTQNKVPPASSGTFTGLAAGTAYKVRLTLQAQGSPNLFQNICTAVNVSTQAVPPTIYARLEYQDTSAGSCAGNKSYNFIKANAYWRTYSNAGATIPYVLPSGSNAIIEYDRVRLQSTCSCSSGSNIVTDNTQIYNLTLTNSASQTIVPSIHKYSGQTSWYICENQGTTCNGGDPGIAQCASNYSTNNHYLDPANFYSIGTTTVNILAPIVI